MAENIDELQIEIESDASSALDGLDGLAKSLEKLKKAASGVESSAKELKALVSPLRSLSKLDNLNLTANIGQLEQLTNTIKGMKKSDFKTFSENVQTLSGGITALGSMKSGNIGTVSTKVNGLVAAYEGFNRINFDFGPQLNAMSSAISNLSATSAGLNNVDYKQFESNIVRLSKSLQPLQGFKSQASGLLNALRSFPETASALNDFDGFDQFGSQLGKLRGALDEISGVNSKLGATLDALTRVNQVSNNLNSIDFDKFRGQAGSLAGSLEPLQNVNTKLGSTLNNLSRVGTVAQELSTALKNSDLKGDINTLKNALSGLSEIGKNNLGSTVSALKQIPKITASLDAETLKAFSAAIRELTDIIGPLSEKMAEIGRGFSMLPDKMKAAIKASDQMTSANKRSASSFGNLSTSLTRTITKFTVLSFAFKRVWTMFGGWFNESSEYIESMNLFRVTMGDATDGALEFAETVQDLMGIDISQWVQNQGVFMQMATGFGIASDKAELMSRNLTQLAYDMSSFFNTDVETAMQKLQSGLSGQIKGLKAFGINLSVAALQETALSLGIDQSVRSMTEAQKAQLRYITVMQRSKNIMGDMARTLVTPANAMRILSAQMTQLKRALGDIVSALLTNFIPYIQVFVRLLTDAAKAVAKFFGFKEIKIDYSGLELGSDVMDGIDESIEDTTEKTKELKKQLMGFDELNILKSDSKSDDSNIGASNDLGIDMSKFDYDFLGNLDGQTRELYEKVKGFFANIKDQLDDFAPLLSGIATAFAAAFAFSWIGNALSKFAAIPAMAGGITALKTAIAGAAIAFKLSKNPFLALGTAVEVLWTSFKKFMSGLSPFQKTLVSVVALGIEFGVVKDAVSNFAEGNTTLGKTLLNIIPVCGAVGVAMYAMLGPWGLAAAAITGVVAAIAGFNKAQEKIQSESQLAAFFDGVGVSISNVSNEVVGAIDSFMAWNNVLSEYNSTISGNTERTILSQEKISGLTATMAFASQEVAGNYVPQLKQAFSDLHSSVSSNIDLASQSLTSFLSLGSADMFAGLGTSFDSLASGIATAADTARQKLEGLQQKGEELRTALAADPNNKDILAQLDQNARDMAGVWLENVDGVQSFQSALDRIELEGIDFSNIEDATAALQDMSDAYTGAVSDINTSIEEQLTNLRGLFNAGGMSESEYETQKAAIVGTGMELKADLAVDFSETYAKIEAEFAKQLEDAVQAGLDNATVGDKIVAWWDNLWNGSDMNYSDTLKANITQDFLEGDIGSVFDEILQTDTTLHSHLAEFGKNMGLGIAGGLGESDEELSKGMLNITDLMKNSFKEANGIHSPSTVYEELASHIPSGIANGISRGTSVVESAVRALASSAAAAWSRAISSYSFNLPSVSGRSMGNAYVRAYASGGYPTTGEMFIANEAGPELVGRIGNKTAVANNDQITAGIASAVYEAMMAAQSEGGGSKGGTARIVVQIGERAVGEAAVEYVNGQIRQTGTNPINY